VRLWKHGGEDRLVIVANTTFRMAPWADAVFAMDRKWWTVHYAEVCETFTGRRLTVAALDGMKVEKLKVESYRNSGGGCISVAVAEGATEVVLLGYDCSLDEGRTHWHGSHPEGMSDAKTIKVWPLIFNHLAKDMKRKGVHVVNATRRTALTCFEKVPLEETLRT